MGCDEAVNPKVAGLAEGGRPESSATPADRTGSPEPERDGAEAGDAGQRTAEAYGTGYLVGPVPAYGPYSHSHSSQPPPRNA